MLRNNSKSLGNHVVSTAVLEKKKEGCSAKESFKSGMKVWVGDGILIIISMTVSSTVKIASLVSLSWLLCLCAEWMLRRNRWTCWWTELSGRNSGRERTWNSRGSRVLWSCAWHSRPTLEASARSLAVDPTLYSKDRLTREWLSSPCLGGYGVQHWREMTVAYLVDDTDAAVWWSKVK